MEKDYRRMTEKRKEGKVLNRRMKGKKGKKIKTDEWGKKERREKKIKTVD